MLRPLLAFALSRRAIVMLGLFVLIGGGLWAFAKINIEAHKSGEKLHIRARKGYYAR